MVVARTRDLRKRCNPGSRFVVLTDVRRLRPGGFTIFVFVVAAACTLGAIGTHGRTRGSSSTCPDAPGFICSTLAVPLDRSGHARGTLGLRVAAQQGSAPRGVVVFLTGGPGQPGEPFAGRVAARMGHAFSGYRLVLFDQRGTGGTALRCPALQRQMGSSDLAVPTRRAVVSCARAIGPKRRFFTTADTVEDLEALRRSLGVDKLTLDGVSYGTFVAERYAIRHPTHVARLVLDSVVPHPTLDPLYVADAKAVARVLRLVCREQRCPGDPARDFAFAVRHRAIGNRLLDALVTMSVADPSYPGVSSGLHAARSGNWRPLLNLIVRWRPERTPAEFLSQGLHASTLCGDTRMPWGSSAVALSRRPSALRRAVAKLRDADVWPLTRGILAGNGIVKTCLWWPPTPAPPEPRAAKLPPVPTLLLAGDHDLSTPLTWARDEARAAPKGKLVVIHGSGHSTQMRASVDTARDAVAEFLH
jgi:pimeloyl-ACP methyl ester carboxylesterase